jgi:hypothetical protein
MSAGLRPGTQIKHSLPELVVTRWTRPPRVTLSPLPDIRSTGSDTALTASATREELPAPTEVLQINPQQYQKKSKSKKSSKSKASSHRNTNTSPPSHPGIIDPKEPRYCYCDQVSFGEASPTFRQERISWAERCSIDDWMRQQTMQT